MYACLGIDVTVSADSIILSELVLIDKLIKYCKMEDSSAADTPDTCTLLGTDIYGAHFNKEWKYASVVGMDLYLSGNSRPDIQLAVHQLTCFTHCPKAFHTKAVQRLCKYLKGTRAKGLTFKKSKLFNLDCYVDADFSGLWNFEDIQDLISVHFCCSYLVTLGVPSQMNIQIKYSRN